METEKTIPKKVWGMDMFQKIREMRIKKKLSVGYGVVIAMMVVSGFLSLVALTIIQTNLKDFERDIVRADQAVSNCRININIAARNIREMALVNDTTRYAAYENKVEEALNTVIQEIGVLRSTGVIAEEIIAEYEQIVEEWATISSDIIDNQKNSKILSIRALFFYHIYNISVCRHLPTPVFIYESVSISASSIRFSNASVKSICAFPHEKVCVSLSI